MRDNTVKVFSSIRPLQFTICSKAVHIITGAKRYSCWTFLFHCWVSVWGFEVRVGACINLRVACLVSIVVQPAGGSDSQQSKGIVPLSSLSKEQMQAYIEEEGTWLEKPSSELIILTYNVWFREDLELQARMDAIGDIILQHRPHIIFFQV